MFFVQKEVFAFAWNSKRNAKKMDKMENGGEKDSHDKSVVAEAGDIPKILRVPSMTF